MTIEDILKRLDIIEQKADKNAINIMENSNNIGENLQKIEKNTGALDVLRAFKTITILIFIMWLMTFITLICFIFK